MNIIETGKHFVFIIGNVLQGIKTLSLMISVQTNRRQSIAFYEENTNAGIK